MLAILVLLLAAFSRLIPHMTHAVPFNFTAVGAGLLFLVRADRAGKQFSRSL